MILPLGLHKDPDTGEVHERYLIFGRTVKDAQMKKVGSKNTSLLSFGVSPGRDEELVTVKLWGYDADENDGLKKGSTILADCLLDQREYNGRTYKDYTARVFSVLGADTPVKMTGSKRTKDATVEPENPYSGFTDVSSDDLPF